MKEGEKGIYRHARFKQGIVDIMSHQTNKKQR